MSVWDKYYNTPAYPNNIKKKKEKLNVSGEEPVKRSREFSRLNYLLGIPARKIESDEEFEISQQCELPNPEDTQSIFRQTDKSEDEIKAKKLKIAKAKAGALKLKLLLLKQ